MNYYDKNAKAFIERSLKADMTSIYNDFFSQLNSGATILDIGCGAGRDIKYFLNSGYKVTALDPSNELSKFASKYTGIEVHNCNLEEFVDETKYDAIWACASLLHIPKENTLDALKKITMLLKDGGVAYLSWKYGNHDCERDGRHFSDFKEEEIEGVLQKTSFKVKKLWVTSEKREWESIKWLNLIAQKSSTS